MSKEKWKITEHIVRAAHLRGFIRSAVVETSEKAVRIAVKQYTPLSNPSPSKGDVTLVMSGGIGVNKEAFEPFFDALLNAAEKTQSFKIRSVWCADPWNTGASYLLNEDLIGDEPHWLDHSRDLYHFINTFQDQMPPPIIGMGESWGVGHMVMISTWHPRLFSGILALEPALGPGHPLRTNGTKTQIRNWPSAPKHYPAALVSRRKDRWKNMEEAVAHLSKSPFYADMDKRARDKAIQYDLRQMNDESGSYVTLATPKRVEAQYWGRPDPPFEGIPPYPPYEAPINESRVVKGFYRPEGVIFNEAVHHVPCPTLLVWGGKSFISRISDFKESYARRWGSAMMGGGGLEAGQVSQAFVEKAGHAISLHKPDETAEVSVSWIGEMAKKWMEDCDLRRTAVPFEKKLSEEWMGRVNELSKLSPPKSSKI